MTMLCVESGVPIGTVFLDSPEGPSSATAAFYCYFPEISGADKEMRVVCDTVLHASTPPSPPIALGGSSIDGSSSAIAST